MQGLFTRSIVVVVTYANNSIHMDPSKESYLNSHPKSLIGLFLKITFVSQKGLTTTKKTIYLFIYIYMCHIGYLIKIFFNFNCLFYTGNNPFCCWLCINEYYCILNYYI